MLTTTEKTWPLLSDIVWTGHQDTALLNICRYATLLIVGSLAIGLSAQISIPLYPVPITGQTLGVYLVGLTYGWRLGGATVLLYLLQGAMGLPVFAGGASGLVSFMTPSGGYLFGYVLAAAATGFLAERGYHRSYLKMAVAMFVGNCFLYACGLLWLGAYVGWDQPILAWGFFPFIPGGILKSLVIIALFPVTYRTVEKFRRGD